MTNWRDDPVFAGVDLEDTWIVGWVHDADARELRFETELSLTSEHPAYVPPPPSLWTCYRYATVVFEGVNGLTGFRRPESLSAHVDPDGATDYGNFDQCEVESGGAVTLAGEFGVWRFQSTAHRVLVGDLVDAP